MEKINYPKDLLEKMQDIVDNCMGDSEPYCESTCPMHTDVKGYVNLIGEGKHKESLALIREKLFLPASLGRICAHPCEEECKRGEMKAPLAIASLKRFVADHYEDEADWDLTVAPSNGKKVAVIGAGPAGAQAALDLAKKGYAVTVYEKLPVYGGMMHVGIPEYRLPRDIIHREYTYLEKLGVTFKMGVEIGKDISLEQLKKDNNAVIVAVGAHVGNVLPIEGSDANGVLNAVDVLREIALTRKYDIGKRLLVIGGGNVAIDVARSARRVGVEEVILTCLETTKDTMPAHDWEVEEAEEEGVTVRPGYGPVKIVSENGKVTGIEMQKCLSVLDKDGNFNPEFAPDKNEIIPIDNVCFAIGQLVDNSFAPDLEVKRGRCFVVDDVTLQSKNDPQIFVAGDAAGNSVIVIEAMAEGRKAAKSVDLFLQNKDMTKDRDKERAFKTNLETTIPEDTPNLPRIETTQTDPKIRIKSFDEVDLGLKKEQAEEEAKRCLKCECKVCMKECTMLNDYCDCPKDLFKGILESGDIEPAIPYSCNMCNQCTIVCPKDYKMADHFMTIRKKMVVANKGKSPMKGHSAIGMHQLLGFSKPFNTTVPSPSGKTKRVFIPGCSLPSYNPEVVGQITRFLEEKLPGTGAILKCCGKPTKALGQVDKFEERYAELQREIDKLGAEEIIVACQSCYLTMGENSPNQKVTSLWEIFPELGLPKGAVGKAKDSDITFAIHDACPTRNITGIHTGVRWVMDELGYNTEEPPHTKENTMCCGFGGMIVPAVPELAGRVMKKRTAEVKSDHMVTYCAACRESMYKGGKDASHILDLVFGETMTKDSKFNGLAANPVESWGNRYKAKKAIQRALKK